MISGSGGKNFPKVYQRSKQRSLPSPSSSLFEPTQIQNSDTDFPKPPPGGPEGPPPRPPPDDENGEELTRATLHQRSNLSRVQIEDHYPSNLKVIDRYDSSSLSIKGPNPTGLAL